jgi:rhamnose transport system permease protein
MTIDQAKEGTVSVSQTPTAMTLIREHVVRWEYAIAVVLVAVVTLGGNSVSGFLTPFNLDFRIVEVTPTLLIALPMTLLIVAGEIDLSVASMLGLSSALMGVLFQHGWPLPLVVCVCLVLGIVMGAVNGFFVTVLGLPALAVTIGTLGLYRGLAYVLLGGDAVSSYPPSWTTYVRANLAGTKIPVMAVLLVVMIVIFAITLHATPVGRSIFAMGANADGATFAGIAVARTKFMLFVVSGIVSAAAGVLYTLRFGSSQANNATGLELVVITAVLLGGVSIFGGEGSIFGVVCAGLLLEAIQSLLQLKGVDTSEVVGITGLLLIISVVAPNAIRAAVPPIKRLFRSTHDPAAGQ